MRKASAFLLVALLTACGSPEGASSPSPETWTTDTAMPLRGFSAGCHGDACSATSMDIAKIPPQSTATDVVVQITVEGKTAPDDWASLDVGLDPGTMTDPTDNVSLRPGSYRVVLPAPASSTTLRWVKRNVPASTVGYDVSLGMTSGAMSKLTKIATHVSVTESS
jgi:hypothetical protein